MKRGMQQQQQQRRRRRREIIVARQKLNWNVKIDKMRTKQQRKNSHGDEEKKIKIGEKLGKERRGEAKKAVRYTICSGM